MRILVFLGALFAASLLLQTSASAEGPYCLESADGGGGSTINCAYESMAQCLASKSQPSDRCMVNPRIGTRR
ncbi:MAG TPA: DUF3551 domain-containing protein [Xanthobacteraceae bacterium]|nr:DUF3551 domain-containing protein [Xanthobacteraceae bacterium]